MTKKQFNRDYFVRVRFADSNALFLRMFDKKPNFLISYDLLMFLLGDRFDRVISKVERARACKVVVKPVHGVEITFIAH